MAARRPYQGGKKLNFGQFSHSGYNPTMHELISVVSFFLGIPLFIIGWVMSIVAVKRLGTQWMLGMIFVFPITIVLLSLIHWHRAKKPLLVTVIGTILVLITLYYVPEQ
jgi:hypothetical protein